MITNMKYFRIEKTFASLYIYLIAFRMIAPFTRLSVFLGVGASYFDVIINLLGLFIALFASRGKIYFERTSQGKAFKLFVRIILFLNFSSLVMACVTQLVKGNYAGESAFSGILGMEIYYFQYIFMIGYNIHISHMFNKEEIYKILNKVNIFLLCLGYYDILIVLFGSIFKQALLNIDIFEILYYETNSYVPRVLLTANESSNAAEIVCILIIPFLLANIYSGRNKKSNTILILLWMPILVFMQSTSAYLMLFASFIGVVILDLLEKKKKRLCILFLVLFVLTIFVSIIGLEELIQMVFSIFPEDLNVKYLILEKIFSQNTNGSTTSRTVPFYINWGAFTESPIIGVGNGLQGYYYNKYFPSFAYYASDNREIMRFYERYQTTIANGAIFFPSILSGYGIVGILLIILFCKKCKNVLMSNKKKLDIFYYYFIISLAAIIIAGFKSDFAGKYYLWFVLSIPFMSFKTSKKIEEEVL